jgi:hypothetical protein
MKEGGRVGKRRFGIGGGGGESMMPPCAGADFISSACFPRPSPIKSWRPQRMTAKVTPKSKTSKNSSSALSFFLFRPATHVQFARRDARTRARALKGDVENKPDRKKKPVTRYEVGKVMGGALKGDRCETPLLQHEWLFSPFVCVCVCVFKLTLREFVLLIVV